MCSEYKKGCLKWKKEIELVIYSYQNILLKKQNSLKDMQIFKKKKGICDNLQSFSAFAEKQELLN